MTQSAYWYDINLTKQQVKEALHGSTVCWFYHQSKFSSAQFETACGLIVTGQFSAKLSDRFGPLQNFLISFNNQQVNRCKLTVAITCCIV